MAHTLINTPSAIQSLLQTIATNSIQPPLLFIDLEGVNLSRNGSISIIQILIPPARHVFIVDIHILQGQALSTPSLLPGQNGTKTTLKSILESTTIPKLFFDVRRDSDALFAHFNIRLQAVVDIQLLEFATRIYRGQFLSGLGKCIDLDGGLSHSEKEKCQRIKSVGVKMFAPEKGGSYDVWLQRPLPKALVDYCVQDVTLLPNLLTLYASRLGPMVAAQVHEETLRRVTLSQSPTFNGDGKHMAIGPTLLNLGRNLPLEPLKFPMSTICSKDLARLCVLEAAAAVSETL